MRCGCLLHAVAGHRLLVARPARRFVIGQIIGASNYDLGHLALGQPGGGVANLGVVGRSAKARRLHRHPDADGRLLRRSTTWPTRWATSSAATTRSTAPSSTARAATATPRPRSSPAPAPRSWPTRASARPTTSGAQRPVLLAAQPPGDLDLHVVGPGRDQRGPDAPRSATSAAATRSRSRRSGRASSRRRRSSRSRWRSARCRARRSSAASPRTGTLSLSRPAPPARRTRSSRAIDHDLRRGERRLQRHVHGQHRPDHARVHVTNPVSGLPRLGRRHDHAQRARPQRGRETVTVRTSAAHNRSVGDQVMITGAGERLQRRRRSRSPPCRLRGASSSRTPSRVSPTRAAAP